MASAPNPGHQPKNKRPALVPLVVVVAAVIVGLLVFNLTRSQPNYDEETFDQAPPETTT